MSKLKTAFMVCSGLAMLVMSSGNAQAMAVAGSQFNFATGQDALGNIQTTNGSLDAKWIGSGGNYPTNPGSSYVVDSTGPDWYWQWPANSNTSSWIAVNPYEARGNGAFSLTYNFDLTGYNLSTASFSGGKWTIDDAGSIILNGKTLGSLGSGQWDSFHDFTFSANDLLPGMNSLQVVMGYQDSYLEAARVEGVLSVSRVPLPAALPLFGFALGGLGVMGSRRKTD